MIVKCKAVRPTEEAAAAMGISQTSEPYMVTLGKNYVVLGLVFPNESSLLSNEVAVAITDNGRYVVHVPLALFDVIDDRVSSTWVMRRNQMGGLSLWPPSFFADFYHDDLTEGASSVFADFRQVYTALCAESGFSDSKG